MNRRKTALRPTSVVALALALVPVFGVGSARGQDRQVPLDAVWIYKDMPRGKEKDIRSATEILFGPGGYMPGERAAQIHVNIHRLVNPKDPAKGTCIEYAFRFADKNQDWQGVHFLVDGDQWATKPGINLKRLLRLADDEPIYCRFRAKGEVGGEVVTFQCGGLDTGPHRTSLPFEMTTKDDPVRLGKDFADYVITLKAKHTGNIVDPFCVIARAVDNRGKDSITILVDDARFEGPRKAKPRSTTLPAGWRDRLAHTLFIAYTPTGFDPTVRPAKKPTPDDIRADLAAFRALADKAGVAADRVGIVTYGCRDGLEAIAPIAKEFNLSVMLGVFNPRDEVEAENAEKILERDDLAATIAGVCCGNECVTFRRATFDDVRQLAARLSQIRRLPTTTTEIIQSYGKEELFNFDFSFVNAHAIFSNILEPKAGAEWAIARLEDLIEAAPKDHLIFAKELGWPGGPLPFDEKQQALYWKTIFGHPVARRVNVCIFDSIKNVAWKNEMVSAPGGKKVNIGPHWAVLLDAQRQPTALAATILSDWKKTRGQ